MNARLELADYRRQVAENYLSLAGQPPAQARQAWRERRDQLFATHPQSALDPEQKQAFAGLPYFDYDERFRFAARLVPASDPVSFGIDTGGNDGTVTCEQVGVLEFELGSLGLFWIRGYGGGLFLPFRDGTGNTETYGGGRYLVDTLKGTFGGGLVRDPESDDEVTLDFNFAYNPSCVYNAAYACPLAPRGNWLTEPIRAGEKVYPKPV